MNIKSYIPNAITCGNLFCGCIAIVVAFNGYLVYASYFVGIAAVLDFLDGFVARLLNVKSEIGKQLDSLADMVTFGLVPGAVMFLMLLDAAAYGNPKVIDSMEMLTFSGGPEKFPLWLAYTGFIITIFSALRLAKFNIDEDQSNSFVGLPTPANTILICSLPLIIEFNPIFADINMLDYLHNPWLLLGITLISSYLMVANLPLLALKFSNFKWTDNKSRYLFLILALILLFAFKFIALPIIIFLYIIVSVITN